jgi:hypothetical protein
VVNWSQRARADLKAVHDYIAKDSPQNTKPSHARFGAVPKRLP